MIRRHLPAVLVLVVLLAACSEKNPEYRAEKQLFAANKLNAELSRQLSHPRGEFLDRTLASYAEIVTEFTPIMYERPGLERIVLTAQIALAELEHRAGMLREALANFDLVLELERNEPGARMNAIYSAGVICELLRDPVCAIEHYEKFYNDHLSIETAGTVANEQYRYLVTPLKLADLSAMIGNDASEALWLMRAETLYRGMLDKYTDDELQLNARLNLLSALIQQAKWNDADALTVEIAEAYPQDHVLSSTTFLRGRIRQDGFDDREGALAMYTRVYTDYPTAADAPEAMIASAAILLKFGRTDEAAQIYQAAADRYPEESLSAAEALWQLATLAEEAGDWALASNRFNTIMGQYPNTSYAFEAPIQLAVGYRELGEFDNAASWFRNAKKKYEDIVNDNEETDVMKIMAEEYLLQVYTLQERWESAIEHLVSMPSRYPDFTSLHANFLTAAEIYEKELNDTPHAIEVLQECQSRYPDSPVGEDVNAHLERLQGKRN